MSPDTMTESIDVLLVEDDADCANLVTTAAEVAKVPFKFEFATNGIEALEILHRKATDAGSPTTNLVLLDLNLPLLSGREVLAAMKKDQRLKDIPVVLLSTTDSHSELKREFGLSNEHCYTKPDRFQGYVDLLSRLDRTYRQHQAEAPNF